MDRRELEKLDYLTIPEASFYACISEDEFNKLYGDGYFFAATTNANLIGRATIDKWMLTGALARPSVLRERRKREQEERIFLEQKQFQLNTVKRIKELEKEVENVDG